MTEQANSLMHYSHTHSLTLCVTYSPHVNETSAEERVQVPVDARHTGDIEDFVS